MSFHWTSEVPAALFLKQSCNMAWAAHTSGTAAPGKASCQPWMLGVSAKLPKNPLVQRCCCNSRWVFGCLTPSGLPQGRKSMGCGEKWWVWAGGSKQRQEWCYHWQIILHHLVTVPGFCSRAIFKILPQVTSDFTQAAWLPLEGVKTIFC